MIVYSKILLFMYITIHFLQCYEKFLNGWSHCPFVLPIESTYKKVSIYDDFFPFINVCPLFFVIKNNIFFSFRLFPF